VRALLIGASFYRPGGTWFSLSGCVRDAERLEDFLLHRLEVSADRIRKLTASEPLDGRSEPPEPPEDRPTYENIVTELLRLVREAEPGEQVLIYFAGHGGRIPTCIPEVKGNKAFDKVLVPWDAAAPSARCLRDVELGVLLRELVERQALVTLVLDCCHAGDTTRLAQIPREIGVRGSSIVDARPWPTEGLVGPRPSLAATWQLLDTGPKRNLRLASHWQPNPRGYVLLAACRAMELAFEFPFERREKQGVFTRALLEGLRDLTPSLTYRRLQDRIVAEVHSRFEHQTPVLEGDEDRVVFGDQHMHEPPAVNVLRVEREGRRLLLETGRAQGIERRARFVIQGANGAPVALAQVTAAGAAESWSRLVERYQKDVLKPGLRAVPREPGAPRLCRSIRLLHTPSVQGQRTLDAMVKILERESGQGFVRLARQSEGADFLVSIDSHNCCEIRDPAGVPLPHLPPLSAQTGELQARLLVDLLAHLARFRYVQRLINRDWRSPLRTALDVDVGRPPEDWKPGQPTDFTRARPTRRARCGEWLWMKLANTSNQELNVGVFDLQPDWEISLLLPQDGDLVTIEPGEEFVRPLQVDLPSDLKQGTDLLKAVAVTGRLDFRLLTLPALDQFSPRGRSGMRGAPRRPANELEALFAALTADSAPKRSRQPSRYPGREWATAHIELRVER
jgi:hypothetical protein